MLCCSVVVAGMTTNDPLIGKYCGTTVPPVILGSTSSLLVVFVSDVSNNYKGFTAQYIEVDICK